MDRIKKHIIPFLWLAFCCIPELNAQVHSAFSVNDSTGCENLIVNFTNGSTGTGTLSYNWDFGNGTFSTLQNPSVFYNQPGEYTVRLITTNGIIADTLTKSNFINVFHKPTAQFIAYGETTGCKPMKVKLASTSIPGDNDQLSGIWDMGDGSYESGDTVEHTYLASKNYNISLFIKDSNSCTDVKTAESFVKVLPGSQISFDAKDNKSCFKDQDVLFNNTSVGSEPISFTWTFGDGETSSERNPLHTYHGLGNYNVKLLAANSFGCKDSLIKNDFVQLMLVKTDIHILEDAVCRNQNLTIENNSVGINTSIWFFGDETSSNEFIPIKSYTKSGKFKITYIGSANQFCADTSFAFITVDSVKAAFNTSDRYICSLPFQVVYTDQSINAIAWDWKLGGINHSNQQNPKITFSSTEILDKNNSAYLSDTLIVTSPLGCQDQLIIDSNIFISIPDIYFSPNSKLHPELMVGCAPLTIDFSDSSKNFNPNDPFVMKQWDFDDGSTSQITNPTHSFVNPGEYQVVLSTKTQSGCLNNYVALVKVGSPQTGRFEMIGENEVCGSTVVQFIDKSSDSLLVNGWKWSFGDGTFATEKEAKHRFVKTGLMTVSLIPYYNGCAGEKYEVPGILKINEPAGEFGFNFKCEQPLTYNFSSAFYGTDSLFWNFGDGSYDTTLVSVTQLTHTFQTPGTYLVNVRCANKTTNCHLSITKILTPKTPTAVFSTSQKTYCADEPIWFNPKASSYYTEIEYGKESGYFIWDFGDGTPSRISRDSISHIFEKNGMYDIRLVLFDNYGCSDTLTKPIRIFKPEASFSYTPDKGCEPLLVNFTNQSKSDTLLNEFFWDFGNNLHAVDSNTHFTFNQTGLNKVQLIATDILSCTDTATSFVDVYQKPVPAISLKSTNVCLGSLVHFTNLSTGNANQFHWDFGDGTVSDDFEPDHKYNYTGEFTITLSLENSSGCDSTITLTNYIKVHSFPAANFTVSSNNFGCYPALANFTDLSEGENIVKWSWDFGDQTDKEFTKQALHTYHIPGQFTVLHTAENAYGCIDTMIIENALQVGGPFAEIVAPDFGCINTNAWIKKSNEINVQSHTWLNDEGQSFLTDSFLLHFLSFRKYEIYLVLKSDTVGSCIKTISDSIDVPFLKSNLTLISSKGCTPLQINASDISIQTINTNWFFDNTWISDQKQIEYVIEDAGMHELKLLSGNQAGCLDSVIQPVEVYAKPDITLADEAILCQDDSVLISASGGVSYVWSPDKFLTGTTGSAIYAFPPVDTKYYVLVENEHNCQNSDSIQIIIQQKPIANIQANDTVTIIIGEKYQLEAQQENAGQFSWYPANDLDCPDCLQTEATPLQSVLYYFIAADENNCFTVKDSIYIKVDDKFSVSLPNAFSPNNDGVNDKIFVKGWGINQLKDFRVYNENGLLVYTSTNIEEGWNGIYNHAYLNDGVYFYTVTVEYLNHTFETKSGYIYILK